MRLEIGTLGFFQCFCDVYEHTKPLGISSKYYGWRLDYGWIMGWIMGGCCVPLCAQENEGFGINKSCKIH